MTVSHSYFIHVFVLALILASGIAQATAAERSHHGDVPIARTVTFKLTFANRDLIWLGDPASPTALMYLKPAVRPIATDCYVTARIQNNQSPYRHYICEARIVDENGARQVYAFTEQREKVIGTIDDQGRFSPNEFYKNNRSLLPTWPADVSVLAFDSAEKALYYEVDIPGPLVTESLDFLPLELSDAKGNAVTGRFAIDYVPSASKGDGSKSAAVALTLQNQNKLITLAKATLPSVFRRADVKLCSFDNKTGAYLPENAYRASATDNKNTDPSVTVKFTGEFTSSVQSDSKTLVVAGAPPLASESKNLPAKIVIDGKFDDWRNVPGVDDPLGDLVPYLNYDPDVDLLEFKVSHDDQHIYLYARVAGQIGRSHHDGGRSYFYAYMDVDRNPRTGFLPTRDDDCYFGVDVGDDCEVQFEFVNNALRKAFYGFCGLGGNDNVLKQVVTIGKSQYGRFDANGAERANYKSEYIYREGATQITEDLKLGTSDTIQLALSPDGSEVEISSTFTSFLKDANGRPIVGIGQTIDLAAGMECDGNADLGKTRWAADSTKTIRGYRLSPPESHSASKQRANE